MKEQPFMAKTRICRGKKYPTPNVDSLPHLSHETAVFVKGIANPILQSKKKTLQRSGKTMPGYDLSAPLMLPFL